MSETQRCDCCGILLGPLTVWLLFRSTPDSDDVVDVFASEEAALKYQREHDMEGPVYFTIDYEVRE